MLVCCNEAWMFAYMCQPVLWTTALSVQLGSVHQRQGAHHGLPSCQRRTLASHWCVLAQCGWWLEGLHRREPVRRWEEPVGRCHHPRLVLYQHLGRYSKHEGIHQMRNKHRGINLERLTLSEQPRGINADWLTPSDWLRVINPERYNHRMINIEGLT